MEPLKPEHKKAVVAARIASAPEAEAGVDAGVGIQTGGETEAEELMAEYERLLAERFMTDPDAPPAAPVPGGIDREERLKELHSLLFENATIAIP